MLEAVTLRERLKGLMPQVPHQVWGHHLIIGALNIAEKGITRGGGVLKANSAAEVEAFLPWG